MKRLSIVLLSLGLAVGVKAQSELTLPFMNDIFQSSYINPTIIPEHTVSIGFPSMSSVYGQLITNGFVPKKVTYYENDTLHIDPVKLLAELRNKNLIYSGVSVDIFHLRMKIRNGYYWFGIRNNFTLSFQYPRDLVALLPEGNARYVGSSIDFGDMKIDASLYNEYSFGMAKEFNQWIFGGRISLLQGLTNIQFDPKIFNVAIDTAMYPHTINANVRINTAGIPMNSDGDPSFDHVKEASYISNYFSNFDNKGVSLSAGVTYKFDDRLNFTFSFYDLGFISWKDSVTNYNYNGKGEFSGLDLLRSYLNDTEIRVDTIIDSILDDFERDTIHKAYRTYLYPKFYASASYDLFRRTNVGLSISGVYDRKFYPAFTLGLSQGLGRFFNLQATIAYNQRSFRNLGVGLVIKPGPFQFFVVADNVYPSINPLYTTNVNVRVGMNLVFGRVKPPVGLPYR